MHKPASVNESCFLNHTIKNSLDKDDFKNLTMKARTTVWLCHYLKPQFCRSSLKNLLLNINI